jgi:signal recognition particle subunit SRP72
LLQTDQYDLALSLINVGEHAPRYAFEKAYSLYRLQRETEAEDVLASIPSQGNEGRGVLHLEAQLVSVLFVITAAFFLLKCVELELSSS